MTNQIITSPTNKIWKWAIPVIDTLCLIVFLGLVFGVDYSIVFLQSGGRQFLGFWQIMVGLLVFYLIVFFLELMFIRKKLLTNRHGLDWFLLFFIVLRNVFFIANFVPLLHLGVWAISNLILSGDFLEFDSLFELAVNAGIINFVVVLIYIILIIFRIREASQ